MTVENEVSGFIKDAEYYLDGYKPNAEYPSYYHESSIIEMINRARIDALTAAMNVVKTYKVGNSGSWMDAAVDREPIIKIINKISH